MVLSTLLRLTMVGSIVYCTVNDQPQYLWLPVLTLLIFIVRGIAAADGDALRVDTLGEQTYYLAFLGTLSTLLGLFMRIYLDGTAAIDLHSMVLLGIVAALTTQAGFLGMATLKEYAQRLADQGSPMTTPVAAVAAAQPGGIAATTTVSDAGLASTAFEEVTELNRKLVDLIARIMRFLESLPAALSDAEEAFVSTGERAHEIARVVKTDVSEMNSMLDELHRLEKRVLDVEEPVYAHEER